MSTEWDGLIERRISSRDEVSGDGLYQMMRALHRRMDEEKDARLTQGVAIADLGSDIRRLKEFVKLTRSS